MLSRASVTEVKLIVKKAVKISSRPTEIVGNQLKKKSKDIMQSLENSSEIGLTYENFIKNSWKVKSFLITYHSVFSDIGVTKYYSRLRGVLVTLYRDKMTFKYVCMKGSNKKCVYKKVFSCCVRMS